MEKINKRGTHMENKKCEYYRCEVIMENPRSNKRFCCRNCKVKSNMMRKYWKKLKGIYNI